MQIDFHHTVTYVAARLAGMQADQAEVVAYAAQYVDDANNGGVIRFKNGAMYDHVASAHRMLDPKNAEALENAKVWAAFHFLPGNGGVPAGVPNPLTHDQRMVCQPDSPVAQDMLRECIRHRQDANSLHRLGVTMHVYADTWAHQQFSGLLSDMNQVSALEAGESSFTEDIGQYFTSMLIGQNAPLGHGPALHFPDMPYLNWGYVSGDGRPIYRNNTELFIEAADHLCRAIRAWLTDDLTLDQPGLPVDDRKVIQAQFLEFTDEKGDARHKKWLRSIEEGVFSFGPESVTYVAKGRGSWKHEALGTLATTDEPGEQFEYSPNFLVSHWKRFHDAVQQHRLYVLTELLPMYGMTAA